MVKAAPSSSRGYHGKSSSGNMVGSGSASHHKKFKSWRKGKSTKANKSTGASLKKQLRGLQRLQKKKAAENGSGTEGAPLLLLPDNEASSSRPDAAEQNSVLQHKMQALQQQIQSRDASEKERERTKKCHKMRFIERQRTTRLYKQLMSQLANSASRGDDDDDNAVSAPIERELWKLALDQVYIAHFPLDHTSYLSIFQNGSTTRRPVAQNDRLLYKMASCRRRVLERLAEVSSNSAVDVDEATEHVPEDANANSANDAGATPTPHSVRRIRQRVDWIHPSQYERIRGVTTWSTDQERETFSASLEDVKHSSNKQSVNADKKAVRTPKKSNKAAKIASSAVDDVSDGTRTDARFYAAALHATETQALMLQQQEELERELDEEFAAAESSPQKASRFSGGGERDDDDDDDDDDIDESDDDDDDEEEEEDDSDEHDEDESEDEMGHHPTKEAAANASRVSQEANKSDGRGVEDDTVAALRNLASKSNKRKSSDKAIAAVTVEEEVDDFLVEASDERADAVGANVFANAKSHVPARNEASGDKSQGWATQRQYPGQFRKKQTRR